MMDFTVIQEQINRLSDAMIAKGLRQPTAHFSIKSHEEPHIYITWERAKKSPYGSNEFQFFKGGTIGEILAKAFAYVDGLPSADEAKFKEFMGALGGVIDLGKENGIEVEFLNPLVATMKQLSENALTDQRAS
jgi:hypothetical protein